MKSVKEIKKLFSTLKKTCKSFDILTDSKHIKVKMSIHNDIGGVSSFTFITPATPSDHRGMKNFRAFIRREFRQNYLESKLSLI